MSWRPHKRSQVRSSHVTSWGGYERVWKRSRDIPIRQRTSESKDSPSSNNPNRKTSSGYVYLGFEDELKVINSLLIQNKWINKNFAQKLFLTEIGKIKSIRIKLDKK